MPNRLHFPRRKDNLRLALLYMNGGSWNGRQLVDPDYIKEALSIQIENEYAPEQKDGKMWIRLSALGLQHTRCVQV